MLSRRFFGTLVLLLIATLILAQRATSSAARATAPLTPPPFVTYLPRFGPQTTGTASPVAPTAGVNASATTTSTLILSATATMTPSVTSTAASTLSPTNAATTTGTLTAPAPSFLPTVTPTPAALVLLPTPTPTRTPVDLPPAGQSAIALLPTVTATVIVAESTPTVTTTLTDSAPITPTTVTNGPLPSPFVTVTIPLPPSYQAQGSFASQTIYTDSTTAQQQGSFTIVQAAAANAYGANQRYSLQTQRAVGESDEISVYQVDNYIAVRYTGGEWMVVRRDQGSNIVRAIQPITDLAILFPGMLAQAELIGQETIADTPTLHYRIDDPAGPGARLIQPMLALTGQIRSLKLDVWIAVPGGFVVAYDFRVELAGARVLDPAGNEVRADQAVTWTYEMTPNATPSIIDWPADAPMPDTIPVPGFALGEFPLPPETELLALVGGVPELISAQTLAQVDSFYRTELFALGWDVTGEGGLLRCSNGSASFELLISEDEPAGGTRISILPGE